jgi:predicted dienelactone hydrolase
LALASCADPSSTTTETLPPPPPSSAPSPSAGETTAPSPGATTDGTAPSTTASAASTDAVETLTLDLVDTSRPTPEGESTPAAPSRTLTTMVWYPSADGPFPLVVFAHGLNGHPDKFTDLLSAWAEAGFVVAAPAFPLTNDTVRGANDNFADVAQQPADMSFVTDQMLAANEDVTSPLAGRIDPERIGFGGLSLGGATTYLAGLNETTRDPRVDAAMVLDGVAGNDPATGTFLDPSGVPAFIAHCDRDYLAALSIAQDAYALLIPPKYLVTMHGTCHAEAFENTPHGLDDAATAITTAFWEAWLAGDGGQLAQADLAAVLDAQGDALVWESATS